MKETIEVAASAKPVDELARRDDLDGELLGVDREQSRSPVTIASALLAVASATR